MLTNIFESIVIEMIKMLVNVTSLIYFLKLLK